MIAEMITKVPGPKSLAQGERIVFENRFEGTNVWDVDGNRYLDLTSAGGTLPFGFVEGDLVPLNDCLGEFAGYQAYRFSEEWLEQQVSVMLGHSILAAYQETGNEDFISLAELAKLEAGSMDLLIVRSEYLNEKDLRMIKSWCQQFGVSLMLDERDLGLYRSGKPILMSEIQPDYVLTAIADEGFGTHEVLFSKSTHALDLIAEQKVAENYSDKDLSRTINLQSMEMNGLLNDMIEDRVITSIGSFHTIDVGSEEEALRICDGLLKRGIIVSRLADKVVLLPSLYLALGEIIFAVNHIKLVVADINEVSTAWMTGELRDQ